MDSMMEIFCEECDEVIRYMRKSFLQRKNSGSYDHETIQELFRGVHTLKADANMMLFENLAEVSIELENLLHCFRDTGRNIDDVERFDKVMLDYMDFYEKETDKVAEGRKPDGMDVELLDEIKAYTAALTDAAPEKEEEDKQNSMESKIQNFYIPPSTSGGASDVKEKPKKKRYMITETDKQRMNQSMRKLHRIIDNMEYALNDSDAGVFTRKQFERLREAYTELEAIKKGLVNTDFVPVAKKMEVVVNEMSEKLQKPVKFSIKGEEIPVEREQREKISGALIHIIRNAMDHGIEDAQTRERLGKSPTGSIKLRFYTENGRLKVSVKDDGRGIDKDKILEEAQKKNLLTKPKEEYTEKEIYNFMLVSGLSTTDKVGKYSGRGVGMDVISHNVSEIGGKLKISSKKGLGTTITMKF